MATVTLNKPFSFLADQDWGWAMTFTSSKITLDDNVHKQTLSGSFTQNAQEDIFGEINSTQYFLNGVLQYTVKGLHYDAHEMQMHAETEGDTQDTYADVLAGNDNFMGSTGADVIIGYGGNDVLDGNGGKDTLYGSAGADKFRFSTALNASSNVDTIKDFSTVNDFIQLDNAIFRKLLASGPLSSSFFKANASGNATDANDYIVYENDTGRLSYDRDGNGAASKVLFALIGTGTHAALTAGDFVVI